jgi:hypothetical protein
VGLLSLLATTGSAFDYAIDEERENLRYLLLSDVNTGISPIITIFKGEQFNVTVKNVTWTHSQSENSTDSDRLFWRTIINGALVGEGNYSFTDVDRELPDSIFVGTYILDNKQTATVVVTFTLDDVDSETSGDYQVYAEQYGWVAGILAAVLFGSYGAPIKMNVHLEVHPLVMQVRSTPEIRLF